MISNFLKLYGIGALLVASFYIFQSFYLGIKTMLHLYSSYKFLTFNVFKAYIKILINHILSVAATFAIGIIAYAVWGVL